MTTTPTTLKSLLAATTAAEIAQTLRGLGDHAGVKLNEPFGPHRLTWRALGGSISNVSTVHLAAVSGRALMERVTNAIDAVTEDHLHKGAPLPNSFQAAGEQLFGRPASGPASGLWEWRYGSYDQLVRLVLRDSDAEERPTVDIMDQGTGIEPAAMPSTILSLHGGNKINKFYLAGTFGQGGSATFAFCPATLIVSRTRKSEVGYTIVRELEMGGDYKENVYAYLADENGAVPTEALTGPLELPGDLPALHHGTLVRHYNYLLDKMNGPLLSYPGNLYHFANWAMFDPLLPFRIIDQRAKYTKDRKRDEIIVGARNRLMKLVNKPSRELGSEVAHFSPMEYIKPAGGERASVGIEYWVVFSRKKSGKNDVTLRSRSQELFVPSDKDREWPVVYTYNGQTQGHETSKILRDVGLSNLSRHMVIHIDATAVVPRIRRDLFATTRETVKDGPVRSSILEALQHMLAKDVRLHDLERQLAERLTANALRVESGKVKEQVVQLLQQEGYRAAGIGIARVKGGRDLAERLSREIGEGGEGGESTSTTGSEPPTPAPFPEVNEWHWNTEGPLEIEGGGKVTTVTCLTDADLPAFLEKGLVALDSGGALEVVSQTPLPGAMRWRLRQPIATATALPLTPTLQPSKPFGSGYDGASAASMTGSLTATISAPSGKTYKAEIPFSIVTPKEKRGRSEKAEIPQFEIFSISPRDEAWATVWPDLTPESTSEEDLQQVAFKPVQVGDAVYVYYSSVFKDYLDTERVLSQKAEPSMADAFRTHYQTWVAFYAVRQIIDAGKLALLDGDEALVSRLLELTRSEVAAMQVRQSAIAAKTLLKTSRRNNNELEAAA